MNHYETAIQIIRNSRTKHVRALRSTTPDGSLIMRIIVDEGEDVVLFKPSSYQETQIDQMIAEATMIRAEREMLANSHWVLPSFNHT